MADQMVAEAVAAAAAVPAAHAAPKYATASAGAASAASAAAAPVAVDEKGVRRRCYDTMNVLLGAGVVRRDGGRLFWAGQQAAPALAAAAAQRSAALLDVQQRYAKLQARGAWPGPAMLSAG
jgi:hypothetical protein